MGGVAEGVVAGQWLSSCALRDDGWSVVVDEMRGVRWYVGPSPCICPATAYAPPIPALTHLPTPHRLSNSPCKLLVNSPCKLLVAPLSPNASTLPTTLTLLASTCLSTPG